MTSDTGQRQEIDALAAIKIPEFKFLLTGRFLFTAGLRMMSTLVAWWIYQLTHSAFAIGVVGLSEFLPAFGLALYAGYVIDIAGQVVIQERGLAGRSHTPVSAEYGPGGAGVIGGKLACRLALGIVRSGIVAIR